MIVLGAMLRIALSGVLPLLLLSAVSVANANRKVKEGPMIDAAGGVTTDTAAGGQQQQYQQQLKVTSQSSDDAASTIRIKCTATQMLILVHADLYNNGGRHVTSHGEVCLGQANAMHPCTRPCQAFAVSDTEYVIEADLNDCGSMLTIDDDSLIYSNELTITPTANSAHVITRKNKAAVVHVACHYKRTNLVSSHPHHTIAEMKKPHSEFSLQLMTDNWRKERSSNTVYLGDMLYIKASYTGPHQASRRLFVENCVATLDPDVASVPRYDFIENHGCFTDSKDSNSQFETRVRSNPLHVKNQKSRMTSPFSSLEFKLETFLFQQDPRNSIFITCKLKATTERSSPTDKACNYATSRWTHVDVNDDRDVCSCCETTCNKGSSYTDQLQHQDTVVVYSMETLDVTILSRD